MLTRRERQDIQWLTISVVAVVAAFSWGALPGLACTGAVVVGGLVYWRRWRPPAAVATDDRADADVLWQDAELALSRLEHLQTDAVPAVVIDRLASAGCRAVEAGRADPFSPHSSDIRHVLGMLGDCLGADRSAGGSGQTDHAGRWARLFDEATLTLEQLSHTAGKQETAMTVRLNVLEREIRILNNKENV